MVHPPDYKPYFADAPGSIPTMRDISIVHQKHREMKLPETEGRFSWLRWLRFHRRGDFQSPMTKVVSGYGRLKIAPPKAAYPAMIDTLLPEGRFSIARDESGIRNRAIENRPSDCVAETPLQLWPLLNNDFCGVALVAAARGEDIHPLCEMRGGDIGSIVIGCGLSHRAA